ncbi:MAG TPA: VOC family protein [Nitrososphaeraceae archaeon]|jgi:catechol 2,3-dioxygenase-like lactoylglutathione lyase family enzyme
MKIRKIVETSIYTSNLEKMKEFYVDKLGLEFVSEQKGRHVFVKTDKNMLLIFNYRATTIENETNHGAPTPPSKVHIAFEIEAEEYEDAMGLLASNNIQIEKEIAWENDLKSRSIYFRDPAGNLVEFITRNYWPVID